MAMKQEQEPAKKEITEVAEITEKLSAEELKSLCDPANYTGLAGEMVDRLLENTGR